MKLAPNGTDPLFVLAVTLQKKDSRNAGVTHWWNVETIEGGRVDFA